MKTFMIIVVFVSLVHGYRESSRYETRKSSYNASPSTSYYDSAHGDRTRESAKIVTTGSHNRNRNEGRTFGVAHRPGVTSVREESYPQQSSNYVSNTRTGYSAPVSQNTYRAPTNIQTSHYSPKTVYKSVLAHRVSSVQKTPQGIYNAPIVNTASQNSKPVYITQVPQNTYQSAPNQGSRAKYSPSVGQTVYNVPELKGMYSNLVSNDGYSSKAPTNVVYSAPQVSYTSSTTQAYRTQVPKPVYGVASTTSKMYSANGDPVQFVYKAPATQALYIAPSNANSAPVSPTYEDPSSNVGNGASSLAVYKAPQTQAIYVSPASSSSSQLYNPQENQASYNTQTNFNSVSSAQYQTTNKGSNPITQYVFKSNTQPGLTSSRVSSSIPEGRPVYRDPALKTIPNGSGSRSSFRSSVPEPVYGVSRANSQTQKGFNAGSAKVVYSAPTQNTHNSQPSQQIYNAPSPVYKSPTALYKTEIIYNAPVDQNKYSKPAQTGYSSPADQAVYRSQSPQTEYSSSPAQTEYRSASPQTGYHSSPDQTVYRSQSSQAVYSAPSTQSGYNSQPDQTVYQSLSPQTTYNAPSSQTEYNPSSAQSKYNGPSSENTYQSQQTIYKSSEAEPQYSVSSSKSTNDNSIGSQSENQYSSQESYSGQTSQNDYSGSAEHDRDYYYLHQPAGSTQDYSTPASIPQGDKQTYYA